VVHHTPSPTAHALLQAVLDGAGDPSIEGVEVVSRPALVAGTLDVLEADGYVLATPANFGYMSGALKHFFDTVYYPCLGSTTGRPYGFLVHGNDDTAGASRAVTKIATGLGWRLVHQPVELVGPAVSDALSAGAELGATLAARLAFEAE